MLGSTTEPRVVAFIVKTTAALFQDRVSMGPQLSKRRFCRVQKRKRGTHICEPKEKNRMRIESHVVLFHSLLVG